MKKMMAAALAGSLLAAATITPARAQNVNINIHINIDRQPSWGPVGYDYAGYYFFPDLNVYYDVMNAVFYHLSGNRWVGEAYLPVRYRRYDLHTLYKVVINDPRPWHNHRHYVKAYSRYKGDRTQQAIRYSTDSRYNISRSHDRRWVDTGPAPSGNNAIPAANQGKRDNRPGNSTATRSNTNDRQSGNRSSSSSSGSRSNQSRESGNDSRNGQSKSNPSPSGQSPGRTAR